LIRKTGEKNLDFIHGAVDVLFVVEHVFDGDLTDFDKIRQEEFVNGFGGVGHENAATKGGFLEKVGQGSGVVQVEVSDEEDVDGGRVNLVEIGEGGHAGISRVDSAIEQNGFAFVGHVNARTTHFISGA